MITSVILLLMGLFITIKPGSLLAILIFTVGIYFFILGFYSLVSFLSHIKYSRRLGGDGIQAFVFLIVGTVLIFNASFLSLALTGMFFVLLGLIIITVGITAIVRIKDIYMGSIFIGIGLIISLFPLGVSLMITRGIGLIAVIFALSLLINRSKSV